MTREEEIKKQAEKKALEPSRLMHPYAKQYKVMSAYEIGYIEGAVWADEHPHWISVEDELPKLNSGMVVVATYKGDIDFMIFSNSGWHNSKRWCCVKGVITHWMPLPQPPKKGDEG